MNNTISSMIDVKPKDGIKLSRSLLLNYKHIQKKPYYLKMAYKDIFINLGNNMDIKKYSQQTLPGVKIRID